MTRLICSVASILMLCFVAADGRTGIGAAADGVHAYFDTLVSSPAHWKSYSLRTQAQVLQYKNANSLPPSVNYDPAADAAKVVIPAFVALGIAAELAVDATQTTIKLTRTTTQMANNVALKLRDEIVTIVRPSGTPIVDSTLTINRGQYGTVPRPHAAGTIVGLATNSLPNQVRLPLGTEDGRTYFFVWDGYWTDSYLRSGLTNHKAFQFSVGSNQSLWLEPQTRFDGGGNRIAGFDSATDVAALEMRAYLAINGPAVWSPDRSNFMGPGPTKNEPILPMANQFALKAGKWTRFFVRIEQRANDYDYMDYWVADETRGPVQIYSRVPISVKGDAQSIDQFWLEFNTSTDRFTRGDTRDLVSYFRNFVALRDVSNVQNLLLRPGAGAPIPPEPTRPVLSPGAPQNIRIIR